MSEVAEPLSYLIAAYNAACARERAFRMAEMMGALMGGGVGLTIGFIFGSYSILRTGAGPRGFLATLSQYMLSSAATFSFFLAIGSVIRTEEQLRTPAYAARMQLLPPHLATRAEGAALIRARWEDEKRRESPTKSS